MCGLGGVMLPVRSLVDRMAEWRTRRRWAEWNVVRSGAGPTGVRCERGVL